jgi:hypothetical protein
MSFISLTHDRHTPFAQHPPRHGINTQHHFDKLGIHRYMKTLRRKPLNQMPWTASLALVSQSQTAKHRSNDAENKRQEEDGHTDPKSPVSGGIPSVVPDAFEISRR